MNTEFSDENAQQLETFTREIKAAFGDAIFCMPKLNLHVTLLDWIAPLVDYDGQDKDELYRQIQPSYDRAMTEILAGVAPFEVRFDAIQVFPSTIIIVGHDNGEYQHIRDEFIKKVELLPGTKLPPQIIHSSLARFTKPIELENVNKFMNDKTISMTQKISQFRLMRSTKEPTLEFEVLKLYEL